MGYGNVGTGPYAEGDDRAVFGVEVSEERAEL